MTTPAQLSAALVDRYRIERELGAGGMATVYLAHDIKHDRNVAIKVLEPELAAVLGAERFVVEIKTTASLQHPHILPLFDSGEAEGQLYYVVPYIQGETIARN
jgi:eukaryotic-like serine/threonine-protein kinase